MNLTLFGGVWPFGPLNLVQWFVVSFGEQKLKRRKPSKLYWWSSRLFSAWLGPHKIVELHAQELQLRAKSVHSNWIFLFTKKEIFKSSYDIINCKIIYQNRIQNFVIAYTSRIPTIDYYDSFYLKYKNIFTSKRL